MKTLLLAMILGSTLLLAGCETMPTLPMTTETITFNVTNETPYKLRLSFFSQHRNAAWPGGDSDYILQRGERIPYSLSCRTTEQICYGAWTESNQAIFWGIGPENDQGCENCCWTCGTYETGEIVLEYRR